MRVRAPLALLLCACLAVACDGGARPAIVSTAARSQGEPGAQAGVASASSATAGTTPRTLPAATGVQPAASPGSAAGSDGANAGQLLVTRNDGLYLRDVGSGRERRLFQVPQGSTVNDPAWSPDGSRFAFTIGTTYAGTVNGAIADFGGDLYLANADGGDRRLLLKHDVPGAQFHSLAWTPDGKALIFTYLTFTHDARGQLTGRLVQARRLNLANGAITPLADNATDTDLCRDGSKLVYVHIDPTTDSSDAIFITDADGSHGRRVLAASIAIQGFLYPRFSPDCTRLVFSANAGSPANRAAPHSAPARELAFVAGAGAPHAAHGLPYDVWTINLDGNGLTRLTSFGEDEPYSAWSPDGTALCVLGARSLYRLLPNDSEPVRIGDGVTLGQLSWR